MAKKNAIPSEAWVTIVDGKSPETIKESLALQSEEVQKAFKELHLTMKNPPPEMIAWQALIKKQQGALESAHLKAGEKAGKRPDPDCIAFSHRWDGFAMAPKEKTKSTKQLFSWEK